LRSRRRDLIFSHLCYTPPILLSFISTGHPPTHRHPLSLHDALPILSPATGKVAACENVTLSGSTARAFFGTATRCAHAPSGRKRSEEHTSELQSRFDLVCRLLLEKKKKEIRNKSVHARRPDNNHIVC